MWRKSTYLSRAGGAPRLQTLPLRISLRGRLRVLLELARALLFLHLVGLGPSQSVVALDFLRVEQVFPPLAPLFDRLHVQAKNRIKLRII